MDIKWCVFDLDGTLLNKRGELTKATIATVREVIQAGIKVILATGRSPLFVKEIVAQLGIVCPVISCNGGLIVDICQDDVLFSKPIHDHMVQRIAKYCLQQQAETFIYSYDHIYYCSPSSHAFKYQRYNTEVQASFKIPLRELRSAGDLPLGQVIKFFICNVDEVQAGELERIFNSENQLTLVSSAKNALDIMANGVSKGTGLKFLAARLGMDLAQTAVFGDNFNDISMFQLAGCPIAVGNAEEKVKAVAKYVTGSNDEDGVAQALRKYVLTESND
jgi:Cof subfamily protein (haloacid dehalogenase superfamily)